MKAKLTHKFKEKMKLIKTLVTAAAGVAYGMFFAQKSGKKLREEISEAKNPGKVLFDHIKKMAEESGSAAKGWAKESQELQEVLKSGKAQFHHIVDGAEDLGKEGIKQMKVHFEELSKNAQDAIKELEKRGGKFKNEVEKEVKTIAKKITNK